MSLKIRGVALGVFTLFLAGCDAFEATPTVNPVGTPGLIPTQVEALGSDTAWISAGRSHTCATKKDGSAYCWGSNTTGELGQPEPTQKQPVPQLVEGAPKLSKITAGDHVTCGIADDSTVYCWGVNNFYQLGQGETKPVAGEEANNAPSASPLQVTGLKGEGVLSDVVSLVSANHRVCALTSNRVGVCWGNDWALVDTKAKEEDPPKKEFQNVASGIPRIVRDVGDAQWAEIKSIAILENEACAITHTDDIRCQRAAAFGTGLSLIAISGAGKNYCVTSGLDKTETNCYESLKGRDSETSLKLPDDTTETAMGTSHGCALTKAGQVWCWGNNRYGQIGNGDRTDSEVPPTRVPRIGAAEQISVGSNHSCARLLDGTTWCWGSSEFGQVGL